LIYSNEFVIFFGRIIRACTRFTIQKNAVNRIVMRLANRGREHPIIDKSCKYGKEEIKWQKKQSPRPMFQPALAQRTSPSAAAIAGTR